MPNYWTNHYFKVKQLRLWTFRRRSVRRIYSKKKSTFFFNFPRNDRRKKKGEKFILNLVLTIFLRNTQFPLIFLLSTGWIFNRNFRKPSPSPNFINSNNFETDKWRRHTLLNTINKYSKISNGIYNKTKFQYSNGK